MFAKLVHIQLNFHLQSNRLSIVKRLNKCLLVHWYLQRYSIYKHTTTDAKCEIEASNTEWDREEESREEKEMNVY